MWNMRSQPRVSQPKDIVVSLSDEDVGDDGGGGAAEGVGDDDDDVKRPCQSLGPASPSAGALFE